MQVQIERSDSGKRNRIYLRSPYSPQVLSKCKQVFGGNWSSAKKVWTYPLDFGTCLQLRKLFGGALTIGPELWKWAAEERVRRERLSDLLDGEEGRCPRVQAQEPKLAAAFATRPYQATGAEYLAIARHGICGDEPGLGKTLETFGAIVESGYTEGVFLVFCPSSAIRATWQREIQTWLPNDVAIPCDGTRKQRDAAFEQLAGMLAANSGRRIWLICNIEMCRVQFSAECSLEDCDGEYTGCPSAKRHKQVANPIYPQLFEREFDAIVLDESHKAIAGTKSRKQKQSQQRVGFGTLRLAEDGMRIALSGTPWRGKPENFWGVANWLRPDIYTGFWRYAEKWHDISDNGFGRTIGRLKPEMEDEWHEELRALMIRRTKAEVAKDLPPKLYAGTHLDNDPNNLKGIWLEMEPKQATMYRKFAAEAAVRLADGTTMFGNGTLSEIGRLRQLASAGLRFAGMRTVKGEQEPVFEPILPSNKLNWLTEVFLPERGIMGDVFGDRKVIIASNYTKTINLFRKALQDKGVQSHCLTGETAPRDRARQIAEFQGSGGPRIFFLNTNAGGTSLTLDAADDVVKIDRTWNPDDDTQVEDRIHRVSRIHQVTVYNLYSLSTIEEEIGRTADEREDIQKQLLDGLRGVKFALKLLGVN